MAALEQAVALLSEERPQSHFFVIFLENEKMVQANQGFGTPLKEASTAERGPERQQLGRKVRQTLPTLLFADPAGGKVKKRVGHICR